MGSSHFSNLFVQRHSMGVHCRPSTELTSLRFLLNNRPTVWFKDRGADSGNIQPVGNYHRLPFELGT
jgi:hypothetical protein